MKKESITSDINLTLTFSMEFFLSPDRAQGTQWDDLSQLARSKTSRITPVQFNLIKDMIKPQLNNATIEQILANVFECSMEFQDTVFTDFQVGPVPIPHKATKFNHIIEEDDEN